MLKLEETLEMIVHIFHFKEKKVGPRDMSLNGDFP